MRRFTVAPLIVLTTGALLPVLSLGIPADPAFAWQEETVTETIKLSFIKPSALMLSLQEPTAFPGGSVTPPQPKSFVPAGITDLVSNDPSRSLTVTGTKAAIAEMKHIVRLLDVKPRQVVLKTRLLETRLEAGGRRTRTILQNSVLSARNNQSVLTAISGSESDNEEISVIFTPHINPDRSISVLAKMQRRWENESEPQIYETSVSAKYLKPNEWNALPTVSFSKDPKIQKAMKSANTPPIAAYPIYRVEVMCNEVTK